jgi:hypothetical protein
MDIDEILINLKVLETIEKNQKLISRGQYLNIEYESVIPEWLRRWRRQDNRNEMIKKINLVINSAIEIVIKDKRRKEEKVIDGNQRILEYESDETDQETEQEIENATYKKNPKKGYNLKVYLQNSITGLRNLKETYATCSQTKARLEVIINKIEQNIKN